VFSCVQWINSLNKDQAMWSQKHKKHVFYRSNSSLKNLVIDFQQQFCENQELGNETFDWVWLTNHFCTRLISFNCGNLSNSIHRLTSSEFDNLIGCDWLCWYTPLHVCQPSQFFLKSPRYTVRFIQTKPLRLPHRSPNLPDIKESTKSMLLAHLFWLIFSLLGGDFYWCLTYFRG